MERWIFALSVAAGVLLAGCSTPPPPPPPPAPYIPAVNVVSTAEPVAPAKGVEWKMVEMDPTFSSLLAVTQVAESRTKDGFKSVHIFVKNQSAFPVNAAYRFEWTGPDGIRVVDPYHDTWETKGFLPGDEDELSSIAPKRDCEDFKLRFRAVR